MKLIFEMELADRDDPPFILRAAKLFTQMAMDLETEACGGPVASKLGVGVGNDRESLKLVSIKVGCIDAS